MERLPCWPWHCNRKCPGHVSSRSLRTHVVTMSRMLSLTSEEWSLLLDQLNHKPSTHYEFYALPIHTLVLATSKLMAAFESGNISEFKGMSLAQIPVQRDECLDNNHENINKACPSQSQKLRRHRADSEEPEEEPVEKKWKQNEVQETTSPKKDDRTQRSEEMQDAFEKYFLVQSHPPKKNAFHLSGRTPTSEECLGRN